MLLTRRKGGAEGGAKAFSSCGLDALEKSLLLVKLLSGARNKFETSKRERSQVGDWVGSQPLVAGLSLLFIAL
jgi:hypothetical protein